MIFSPSQTSDYDFCPRYWAFRRNGWVPRVLPYAECCAILGTGFAAFAAAYNSARLAGTHLSVTELDAAITGATDAMMKDIEERLCYGVRRLGGMVPSGGTIEEFADRLPQLLRSACNLYYSNDVLGKMKILSVEQSHPAHGEMRTDVVVDDGNGAFPVDYKLKVKLEDRWIPKTWEGYSKSHQLRHYTIPYGSTRFGVVLIVLGPKPFVRYKEFAFSVEQRQVWSHTANTLWNEMTSLHELKATPFIVRGRLDHSNRYGECPYLMACEEYGLDQQRMSVEYVQIERRK